MSITRGRLGQWVRATRRLELSRPLVLERPWPEVVSVLGHEMAHLARRDFALKLLYEMLYLPLSFHRVGRPAQPSGQSAEQQPGAAPLFLQP